jgi:hypothetical protein
MPHHIGTLNESPLHAALKAWYRQPGDRAEVEVDGFVIDLVRGELLIEIQTSGFSGIKDKLAALAARHPLRLVYPIPHEKWIVKHDDDGEQIGRRKSPKRGQVEDIFWELVSFPRLLARPAFSLEVLLTREDEIRRHHPGRAWRRRGWVTEERRLLDVVSRHRFETPESLAPLLPASLPAPFTTADLAAAIGRPRRLAQKMAYCVREMGIIEPAGKLGRAVLYVPASQGA